jgi:3-methyl-2-oxobutanoate hydroxymethyltransferase
MVVLGHPDTTHVTMADMIHHTRAVARGVTKTLVAADLPAGSCATPGLAVENSRKLREAGADLVKIEGIGDETLADIVAHAKAGFPGADKEAPAKPKETAKKKAPAKTKSSSKKKTAEEPEEGTPKKK